ncbi:MAG: amino acid ABC transporter substrate-binding protein, partial [Alphaproteobacteria bacterium]
MILTKRSLVAALLGATALGLMPAHAADPIKIGLTGPYTGGSSSMGVSMRDGAKLA